MAHREFIDSDGVRWEVWEVIPQSVDRRKLRERRAVARDSADRRQRSRHEQRLRTAHGSAEGWLVFESYQHKRRLRPIPDGWDRADEVELTALCRRAKRASGVPRRLIE